MNQRRSSLKLCGSPCSANPTLGLRLEHSRTSTGAPTSHEH